MKPKKKERVDTLLSLGCFIKMDKQRRLVLPQTQVAHIDNPRNIYLIGAYDHVVIYSKEYWDNIGAENDDLFDCLSDEDND